jgi:hypothetical protein
MILLNIMIYFQCFIDYNRERAIERCNKREELTFFLSCFHKIFRESTGSASVDDTGYGDPVQKAEAMAFRRACARFGLGLHLYHEDML